MPNPTTCCMCGQNDNCEPKPYMLESKITHNVICEGCVHQALIDLRTFKAIKGGEYGGI